MRSTSATWRSEDLGPSRELALGEARLHYHEVGSGPPVVFVHGVLVNANLWRKVVAELVPGHRCVVLDLPLGSHVAGMAPEVDLSPTGLADLIADAIAALGLEDVTLVGNDTGGALCQLVVTRRPERLSGLVLTSCDAFDNFPPKPFGPLLQPLRIPGVIQTVLAPARLPAVQRAVLSTLAKHPVAPEAAASYTLPPLTDAGVRRDLRKVIAGLDSRHTLAAAEKLPAFDRPAVIAFSCEDRFFPARHAERLAALLPEGRLEWIEDARTFSPEDQPERVAEIVASVARVSAVGAAR